MTETCKIAYDGEYYISRDYMRSNTTWRTFKGALRAAAKRGLTVLDPQLDPAIEYYSNSNKTKIVVNLMSNKLTRIAVNTPLSCDPSSETYWSM